MKNVLTALLFFLLLSVGPLPAQSADTPPSSALPEVGSIFLQANPSLCVDFKDFLGYAVPYTGQPSQRFKIELGLASDKGYSFESVQYPGYFIRHQNTQIKLHPYPPHDALFASDATFLILPRPDNQPGFLIRAFALDLLLTLTRDTALYALPNSKYEDAAFFIK